MQIGDTILVKSNAPLLDRSLLGKAGLISNQLDNDFLVTFANGISVLAKKSHLELVKLPEWLR